METEDSDLVRTVQHGAEPEAAAAFSVLVSRWQARVYLLVRRLVPHRADAEDVTEEVFVRAWKHIRTLRDADRWAPWLLRTARNQVLTFRERGRMRSHMHLVDDGFLNDLVVTAPEVVREDLKQALAAMPPEDMRILLSKYVEDLTYQEIGRQEGVSVSTVRDRLSKARESLSGVLRKSGLLEEYAARQDARRRSRAPGAQEWTDDI